MAEEFKYDPNWKPEGEFTYDPNWKPEPEGFTAGDYLKGLKRGVQGLPGAITGLVDIPIALATGERVAGPIADAIGKGTGFQPGQWAKDTAETFSPGAKAGLAKVDAAWKASGADRLGSALFGNLEDLPEAWAQTDLRGAGKAILENPGASALNVIESVPGMLAGGAIGRGLKVASGLAPALAGAAGEGAITAGSQMDQTDASVSPRTAAATSLAAGALTGGIAAAGGKLAQKLGLEDIQTRMAGGRAEKAGLGPVARVAGGALSEGLLQELPQSIQEQVWQNYAEGKPLGEGAIRSGVEGAIAGGVMGAGANLLPAKPVPTKPAPTDADVAASNAANLEATNAINAYEGMPATPLLEEKPIVVQNPTTGNITELDRRAGPLEAAAASAVESGVTAAAQNVNAADVLQPFQNLQAAQGYVQMQADPEMFDVIPHPRVAGTHAVVPKTGQARQALLDQRAAAGANEQAKVRAAQLKQEEAPNEAGVVEKTLGRFGNGGTGSITVTPRNDGGFEISVTSQTGAKKRTSNAAFAPGTNKTEAIKQATKDHGGFTPAKDVAKKATLVAVDSTVADAAQDELAPKPVQPLSEMPGVQQRAAARASEAVSAARTRAEQLASEEMVDTAAQAANPAPSEAQKSAGNYAHGHITVSGLNISVETPAGATRTGKDGARQWKVKNTAHYGYVKRSNGADGEQVDVYVKPGTAAAHEGPVFVVDQYNPNTGAFDEHKVMMGYGNAAEAAKAYDAHFNDKSGSKRRGAVTEMTVGGFKTWLKHGDTSNPVSSKKFDGQASDTAQAAQDEIAQSTGAKKSLPRSPQKPGESSEDYQRRRGAEVNAARAGRVEAQKIPTREGDRAAVRKALGLADDVEVSILSAASRPGADKAKGVSKQAAEFIVQVARLFGKRVVFFDVADQGVAEGFYTQGNTIYLNVNSSTQHLRILGHELTHAMKRQAKGAYEKMLAAVAALRTDAEMLAQYKDYFREDLEDVALLDQPHPGSDGTLREFLAEEWMADLSGNRFAEGDFWTAVFAQLEQQHGSIAAKGIIAKVRAALVNALNKLKVLIGGNAFAVDARLGEHMEDIRKAVAEGFAEYARLSKAGQLEDVLGGEAKFAARNPEFVNQTLPARWPTAKRLDPVLTVSDELLSNLATLRLNPAQHEKAVNALLADPGLRFNGPADATLEDRSDFVINRMRDNLLWIYDQIPEVVRQRSKAWYRGARAIAERWAERYDVSEAQASGMLAVLSPQKDWFMNVTLAERVLDILHTKKDHRFDARMRAAAFKFLALGQEEGDNAQAYERIKGKTLREVVEGRDLREMGIWLRSYDEAHHSSSYAIITPEGDFVEDQTSISGAKSRRAWGDFKTLGKAANIFVDGRPETINRMLGGEHKVRNFYNNSFAPSDPRYVTVDTHAVAANELRPLSANAKSVLENFGSGATSSSAQTGLSGTYALHLEAVTRAAAIKGELPREMQSITWEAVRGLFTDVFKHNKANVQAIDGVWRQVDEGDLSADDARQSVLDIAGGIKLPDWWQEGSVEYQAVLRDKTYAQGRDSFAGPKVTFEVAPDPRNVELKARWDALSQPIQNDISHKVAWKIAAKAMASFNDDTLKGELHQQSGGWLDDTNPSLSIWINLRAAASKVSELTRMLGFALNQMGMMRTSPKPFKLADGKNTAPSGIVIVDLPQGADIPSTYLKVRGIVDARGEPFVFGHTSTPEQMVIVHTDESRISTPDLANKVAEVLGDEYEVGKGTLYVDFPEKGRNSYGLRGRKVPASESSLRTRSDQLRAEAGALLEQLVSEAEQGAPKLSPVRATADGRHVGLGNSEEDSVQSGRGLGEALRLGQPTPGRVDLAGVHFSKEPRQHLSGVYFGKGTGTKSQEAERVFEATDARIKSRIYAYANEGKGVFPEENVGRFAHRVEFKNLYDIKADPLDLSVTAKGATNGERMNNMESAILDAGFDGYYSKSAFGNQGVAILMGDAATKGITPEYKDTEYRGKELEVLPAGELSDFGKKQAAIAKNRSLPVGEMTGKEWQRLMPAVMPDIDVSHLLPEKKYYKDEIVKRPAVAKLSASREDPYAHIETRPDTTERQRTTGRAALKALEQRLNLLRADRESTPTLLGSRLFVGFVASGGNQLVGQKVASPGDVAALAQIYRDPRFETFRAIFTKGGVVVGESAYSSRLPGAVQLPDNPEWHLNKDISLFGADAYFLIHNHPSGSAWPSNADMYLTEDLSGKVKAKFAGHVVIDHNEYAVIDNKGNYVLHDAPEFKQPDLHAQHAVPHDWLGTRITQPSDAAEIAMGLAANGQLDTPVLVMTTGEFAKVELIARVPEAMLVPLGKNPARARAWIRGIGRAAGAGSTRFLAVSEAVFNKQKPLLEAMIRTHLVTDVVDPLGRSLRLEGTNPSPAFRDVFATARPSIRSKLSAQRLAPNGRPSNLSPEQYAQVRTPAFKKWFGDWEAAHNGKDGGGVWARDDVSKVVDANGEPLVVYHGTEKGGFTAFDPGKADSHRSSMIFAAATRNTARTYSGYGDEIDLPVVPKTLEGFEKLGYQVFEEDEGGFTVVSPEGHILVEDVDRAEATNAARADAFANEEDANEHQKGIYSLFLNIRNPNESYFGGASWDGTAPHGAYEVRNTETGDALYTPAGGQYFETKTDARVAVALAEKENGDSGRYEIVDAEDRFETTNTIAEEGKRYGNDGAIIHQVVDDGGRGGVWNAAVTDSVFVFFNANQAKSATQNTGAFSSLNDDLRYSPPRFFSQLSRSIENAPAKMQTQPAGQWKLWLVNQQAVKKDELTWSGVLDWLDLQGKARVSREDLQNYLEHNGVTFGETLLGKFKVELEPELTEEDIEVTSWDEHRWRLDSTTGRTALIGKGVINQDEGKAYGVRLFNSEIKESNREKQKKSSTGLFGKYVLPGGDDYRELLITLPGGETREDATKRRNDVWRKIEQFMPRGIGPLRQTAWAEENEPELFAEWQDASRVANGLPAGSDRAFRSRHFDQPNILAHLRFNSRFDTGGNKVMFLEELQSDWAEEGRKKGFAETKAIDTTGWKVVTEHDDSMFYDTRDVRIYDAQGDWVTARSGAPARLTDAELIADAAESQRKMKNESRVPVGPFVQNTKAWVALALKRAVMWAVQNGFSKVAWTTGAQQAARYDLRKVVGLLVLDSTFGGYVVRAYRNGDATDEILSKSVKTLDEVADVVGKDAANALIKDMGKGAHGELSGEGLSVGGEGMRAFYEGIVPQVANDLLRKVGGGKVETVEVAKNGREGRSVRQQDRVAMLHGGRMSEQPGFTITPEMSAKVASEGLPSFSLRRALNGEHNADDHLVPETPLYLNNSNLVDLAYLKGKPIRLNVGEDNGPGNGRGALHIVANAARDQRRALEQVTDDEGENVVRSVISALSRGSASLHTQGGGRYALRLPLVGKTAILGDRGDHFNIVTLLPSALNKWGNSDWTGRLTFPAPADATPADPLYPSSAGSSLAGLPGIGYSSEKLKVTPDTPKVQPAIVVRVAQKKHRTIDAAAMARDGLKKFSPQRAQTQTPAFKAWFRNSKVVGANGEPLVVYHGTGADFSTFKPTRTGEFGPAMYFTDNPREAGEYGAAVRGVSFAAPATSIMPAYLSLQNPYTRGVDAFWREFGAGTDAQGIAQAKAAGYDGVIAQRPDRYYDNDTGEFVDRGTMLTHYIVFEPNQIKSAIGNNGQFSPNDPDIRHSPARAQTKTPEFKAWFGDWEDPKAFSSRSTKPPVSVAVDSSGPLLLYHATNASFDTFEVGRATQNSGTFGSWETSRSAIFLTPDVRFSEEFLRKGGGQNVMPVYASIKSPMDLRNGGAWDYVDDLNAAGFPSIRWPNLNDTSMWEMFDGDTGQAFVAAAQAAGYDGAIMFELDANDKMVEVYVVFEPNQIKSAIGNNGQFSPDDPDIRHSPNRATLGMLTPAQEVAANHVLGAPKTFMQRLADFRKDWTKNLKQGIFDQFAPIAELDQNAYIQARLSKGGESSLEALMLYGRLFVGADGATDVRYTRAGGTQGFAGKMAALKGEHDRFFLWVAAQRADRLKAIGLENLWSATDITELKTLNQGIMQDGTGRGVLYAQALQDLNDFNDNVLEVAVASGLIDDATRQMYKNTPYVPFYRLQEDDSVSGFGISPGLVNQYAWKKLKGGTEQLNQDLLANMLHNWSHLITASAKNRAAKATLDAATTAGIAAQIPAGMPGKGHVSYKEAGREKVFVVSDPHLMDAVAALHYSGLGPWAKPLTTAKHWLTVGVTANPAFKLRNLIRDSLGALGTADLSYNVGGNLAQGWQATAESSETRAHLLASGGMIRFGSMLDGKDSQRAQDLIKEGVDPNMILDSDAKIKRMWKRFVSPALDAYNELGDRTEQINRAALYEQLLAKGMTHAEASFWSRDLMDFSMSGKWTAIRTLTQTVPFFNARLQGLYKLGRAGKQDIRRLGTVLGAVTLASLALMLAYEDDDDWKKRSDADRNNYWWFKVGGHAFRLPKPFEIGAVGTLAERSYEVAFNPEMTGGRFGKSLRDIVMSQLSMNPVPQLFKPMMDIYANRDSFSGAAIETLGMERLRKQDRYDEKTSEVAKFLGGLGLPDPTQLVMGRWDTLSPKQVDFLARGYFSWLATMTTTAIDYGIRPMIEQGARPDLQLKDVFFVGNFAESLPSNSSRYLTQMYDQAREIEQAYASYHARLKVGDVEGAKKILADEGDLIRRQKSTEALKRAESLMNQQLQRIKASTTLSSEEKRMRLDQVYARRNAIAERFRAE